MFGLYEYRQVSATNSQYPSIEYLVWSGVYTYAYSYEYVSMRNKCAQGKEGGVEF